MRTKARCPTLQRKKNQVTMSNDQPDIISCENGMALFAKLVTTLGNTTKTNEKLQALVDYFSVADSRDKVWVIALFTGRKPKRAVNSTLLAGWAMEVAGLPGWLFGESYHTVGDLAETIALLLPDRGTILRGDDTQLATHNLSYYLHTFIAIEKESETVRKQFILQSWNEMDHAERFVFNKLITGNFRIGISQKMMVNALGKV